VGGSLIRSSVEGRRVKEGRRSIREEREKVGCGRGREARCAGEIHRVKCEERQK